MSGTPPPPSRVEVERQFVGLLDGNLERDGVDRWAAQWAAADDPKVEDPVVWWALDILFGIDLRHGPDEQYLHDEEQIAEWLAEFRSRCAIG